MMDDVIESESLGSPRAESVRWAQMEPDSDGEKHTLNKDGTFINILSYPLLHTSLNTYILWYTMIVISGYYYEPPRLSHIQVGRGPDAADWLGSRGILRHDVW